MAMLQAARTHDLDPGSRPSTSRKDTRRARASRRVSLADRRAIGLLIALPVLLYVPPSLFGHPVLPGDDLTQNYPLRYLTGELLRSGHLPSWDPLIWSGTPLLAGWNAGSMFPATWLFAVLPGVAAWTVGYVAVPIGASVGAYVLLRRLGCAAFGASIGALAFTYTGFMSGQVVHLGLVQGTALMPWSLLALEELGRRSSGPPGAARLAGPIALLASSAGLSVLAGDPRAVSTTAIADLVYLVAVLLRPKTGKRRLLVSTVVAVGLGALVSAIQWLPGLRFVHSSQRGTTAYTFFGAGSLDLGHIASFLLVPYLFGGNGNFGLPTYAGTYNLPELTIGTGVMSLVAFMAFLPQAAGSLLQGLGRRLGIAAQAPMHGTPLNEGTTEAGRLGVWYVMAGVGLLLTLGTNTPLAHLLVHVPLFGGERLQNRNAALIDLSLAVLLAFFVDRIWRAPHTVLQKRIEKALAALSPVAAVGLIVAAFVDPAFVRAFGGVSAADRSLFSAMAPMLAWELVVALGAMALGVRPRILHHRMGRAAFAMLLACDLGLFLVNASYATAPSGLLSGPTATSRAIARLTGPEGRIAIYDPLEQTPSEGPQAIEQAGAPDLNVVSGLLSVQGYGSLVDGGYDAATKTHGYESLGVGGLAGTTFDVLDLRTLLTLPSSFERTLAPGEALPTPGSAVAGANGTSAAGTAASSIGGPYRVSAHGRRRFVLAAPEPVRAVDLVLGHDEIVRGLRVVLENRLGSPLVAAAATPSVSHSAVATFARPIPTDVIEVVDNSGHSVVLAGVVADTPRGRIALDGPLQGALAPPHWRFLATIGPLDAWQNEKAPGLAWLEPAKAQVPSLSLRASGSVKTVLPSSTGIEHTIVTARTASLLVRSEAYSPGWSAVLRPLDGGPTRVVPVRQLGLVQAVPIPTGRYEVIWRYAPTSMLIGLLASALGIVGLALVLALAGLSRRQRAR
jgi:hypothetical protein